MGITISKIREKIELVELRKLKHSSRTYYITIEPDVIASYGLLPGDLVKIKIIEARKDRSQVEDYEADSKHNRIR